VSEKSGPSATTSKTEGNWCTDEADEKLEEGEGGGGGGGGAEFEEGGGERGELRTCVVHRP